MIIREQLIQLNSQIPDCVYLPTNQTYKVVGIVTNSGMPMQSAARVPILISFEVEDYAGPDKDQILQSSNLINHLVESTPVELAKSLKNGTYDISPQRKLLSPIIEKSGVKMPQIYLEWT